MFFCQLLLPRPIRPLFSCQKPGSPPFFLCRIANPLHVLLEAIYSRGTHVSWGANRVLFLGHKMAMAAGQLGGLECVWGAGVGMGSWRSNGANETVGSKLLCQLSDVTTVVAS